MTAYDPFAGIPNAGGEEDARLDEVLGPLSGTSGGRAGYDIIDRAGQAEYYLREARRAGLALPAYVTIHAVSDRSPQSSRISIQLDSTEDVSQWALHFGVPVDLHEIGPSALLGDSRLHDVKVYYNYPVPADEPMSLSDVTEAACDTITRAAQ